MKKNAFDTKQTALLIVSVVCEVLVLLASAINWGAIWLKYVLGFLGIIGVEVSSFFLLLYKKHQHALAVRVVAFSAISALAVASSIFLCLSVKLWIRLLIIIFAAAAQLFLLFASCLKMNKEHKAEIERQQKKQEEKPDIPSALDVYAILKIAPQYNADGTLKDVYQLLGIEPEYDENGNRIWTIYEVLGINPQFDSSGKEVPFVASIKNKVNSFVKLKEPAPPLYYIPKEVKMQGKKPIIEVPDPVVETKQGEVKKAVPLKKATVVKKDDKKKGEKPKSNLPKTGKPIKISDFKVNYKPLKADSKKDSGKAKPKTSDSKPEEKKKPQIFDAVPDNKKPPKKKPDNGPKIISVVLEKPKTDKPVVQNNQKPKQYTEISLGGNFGGKTLKSKTTNQSVAGKTSETQIQME